MKRLLTGLAVLLLLAGCAALDWPGASRPEGAVPSEGRAADRARPGTDVAPVPPSARTVEDFDTTTRKQKAEAVAGAAAGGGVDLGITIASLGTATEPGFWLKTPLVSSPARGRVVYPGTGKSVQVDLIPIDGPRTAGSRMSLSAMRLIGAPFTGLPEIRVYRTGS